ncbi:MAG: tRNA lysidine(34) synthetase TilS [Flavobacteriales bacterium]
MISERFKNHLVQNFSFLKKKKILIALSGGIDSIVLTHLFYNLKYDIAVAHCNFKLRGQEADQDQEFCKSLAETLQIPFYTIDFNTKKYAVNQKKSIQMAARVLRYEWFEKIMEENNYDFLATAHHLNDNLETFLINLSRGTGLKGLTGIPEKENKIIRPLLLFSKEEIKKYAASQKLKWREDYSNQEEKYLRNHIRLNVVPELEKTKDSFLNQFQQTLDYLKQYQLLVENCIEKVLEKIILKKEKGEIIFDVNRLLKLNPLETYLHLIFSPYGFLETKDLVNVLKSTSGKQLFNHQYRIIKNREQLFLIQNTRIEQDDIELQEERFVKNGLNLNEILGDSSFNNQTEVRVDTEKLIFPLRLRRKKKGDIFIPLGMKGKKKVSKFFKDEKLSIHQKERVWLLENGDGKLIWIVGLRLDDRFKVSENTKKISIIRI